MPAYSSTQSGNFSNTATWGGNGFPNADGDTFSISLGHTVTYDVATPLSVGFGTGCNVMPGGQLVVADNTRWRQNGSFVCSGNFIMNCSNAIIYLKGTTTNNYRFDIRPVSWTRTATTTNATNFITVDSSVDLYVGQKASGTGIATNARITAINGTNVTLSLNCTSSGSGRTITFGNIVELVGPEGSVITNVANAITTSEFQQGYINVESASDFAVGDWIAVFKREYTSASLDRNDEGFLIHDISGNTIYIKEFVGPSANITAVDGNVITVENSKIFREWQKLIFGTGANRNISSITNIDNARNTITLATTPSGSVVGETVYTTGPLLVKAVNDKVRKVATTVATQAASNSTTITLASAAGLVVGDEVIIDSRWPDNNSYTDERPEKRNITAINGNTITLNQSLGYIAYVGSFVVKSTRPVKIMGDYEVTLTLSAAQSFAVGDFISQAFSSAHGFVKTATTNSTTVVVQAVFGQFITGTTNSPWISRNGTPLAGNVSLSTVSISTTQGHHWFGVGADASQTAHRLCKLKFRDVQVGTFSNQGDDTSRLRILGFWSADNSTLGGVELEGITYTRPNQTDNFNYQNTSINIRRYLDDATVRCCVLWNTVQGLWAQEGYNLNNLGMYNNYSARSESNTLRIESLDSSASDGNCHELAYNYGHRSASNGLYIGFLRTPGRGIHHNWINVCQGRTFDQQYMLAQSSVMFQNLFERYFEPIYPSALHKSIIYYNKWIDGIDPYDFPIDVNFHPNNLSATFNNSSVSLEHNFEIDNTVVFCLGGKRTWNYQQNAWDCVFDNDYGAIDVGLSEVYYIPPKAIFKVKGTINLKSTTGAVPKLEVRELTDRRLAGFNGPWAGDNPIEGHVANVNYANTGNVFQSAEVTFPAVSWGRFVTAGVINVNSTRHLGWYEKPLEIRYDKLPDAPVLATAFSRYGSVVESGTDFTTKKTRLGGRLS